jgi:Spy/CpxP family protein refolding chaperone
MFPVRVSSLMHLTCCATVLFGSNRWLHGQEVKKQEARKNSSLQTGEGVLPDHWNKLGLTQEQRNRLKTIQEKYRPKLTLAGKDLVKMTRQLLRLRFAGASKKRKKALGSQITAKQKKTKELAKAMQDQMKEVLTPKQRAQLLTMQLPDRLTPHWSKLVLTKGQLQKLSALLDRYAPDIDETFAEHMELESMHNEIAFVFFRTSDVTALRIYQRQLRIVKTSMDDAETKLELLQENLFAEADRVLTTQQKKQLERLRNALIAPSPRR